MMGATTGIAWTDATLRAEIQRLQHELAAKNQLVIAIARGQMERDCAAVCDQCAGTFDRYFDAAPVWDPDYSPEYGAFVHLPRLSEFNLKPHLCDASRIRAAWSQDHKETPALKPDAAHLALKK